MENFTFTFRGKEVKFQVGQGAHEGKFTVPDNSGGFSIDYITPRLNILDEVPGLFIEAFQQGVDENGPISGTKKYISYNDNDSYGLWYNLPVDGLIDGETLGNYIKKQRVNGVLKRILGVGCVNPDGSFYQPVTFDAEAANGTITATGIDGSAPFKYQLRDKEGNILVAYRTDGVFTGLDNGEYQIYCKDNLGIEASKAVILG